MALERRIQRAFRRARRQPLEPEPDPEWTVAASRLMAADPDRWGVPGDLAALGIDDLPDVETLFG